MICDKPEEWVLLKDWRSSSKSTGWQNVRAGLCRSGDIVIATGEERNGVVQITQKEATKLIGVLSEFIGRGLSEDL